jgi:ABC-type branched-subunit amino acid transport system substrate-binding protein
VDSPASIIVIASLVLIAHGAVSVISVFGSTLRRTMKIGVTLPLSGPSSVRGRETLEGLVRAVTELNAMGKTASRAPTKIELLVFDEAGDPAVAEWVAGELVRRDVIAVVGHSGSRWHESAVSIYETNGVPHFSFGCESAFGLSAGGKCDSLLPRDAVRSIVHTVRESPELDEQRLRSTLRALCGKRDVSPLADSRQALPCDAVAS